jgi:preprotein translocase subunit SecG
LRVFDPHHTYAKARPNIENERLRHPAQSLEAFGTMQTVIIIIHLIIVLSLIGVVLLQRSEGGLGLGGGGGVSGFMTGRGQSNALTRTTAILAGLFFLTSLVLSVMATYGRGPRSIFDGVAPGTPAGQQVPSGQGPGVLEQLQQLQGGAPSQPASPAAPSIPFQAPAAPAPGGPVVPQSQ